MLPRKFPSPIKLITDSKQNISVKWGAFGYGINFFLSRCNFRDFSSLSWSNIKIQFFRDLFTYVHHGMHNMGNAYGNGCHLSAPSELKGRRDKSSKLTLRCMKRRLFFIFQRKVSRYAVHKHFLKGIIFRRQNKDCNDIFFVEYSAR